MSPSEEIRRVCDYIKARYGSPARAWAHELDYDWYDQGGNLPPEDEL